MSLLTDFRWRTKYDPDDGPLVAQFYEQALRSAHRYDRTTGYFSALVLSLVARGVEGLVLNAGQMRLMVGCTLDEPEVDAIERGESLRDTIAAKVLQKPLVAGTADQREALELLAWMVAKGYLDVKVAVPCDAQRNPIGGTALFHEKAGVLEDKAGNRLAFAGSVNETAQGWQFNWESFHVFCGWEGGDKHIDAEEATFARLWSDKAKRAIVRDVPQAVREDLLRFLPPDEREPERLLRARRHQEAQPARPPSAPTAPAEPAGRSIDERRHAIWQFIWSAPTLPEGIRIAEATSAVTPWPHQARAFQRMVDRWPPRLLIADEVGLGKTIEAGLLLRYAWLAGRAGRILVLTPKAVMSQWQLELREKFNLSWPTYDGKTLRWYPSPAMKGCHERDVDRTEWHKEPFVIVSSQLMRRRERQPEILEQAEPWDLVVIDEAHHARRKSPGQANEGPPNLLLRLAQGLAARTKGMLLLTATPMQVHPVEVWDLLSLLGMPPEWTREAFLQFFRIAQDPNPDADQFETLARLFRANESRFGAVDPATAIRRAPQGSRLKAKRILAALRDSATVPRRQLTADERRSALALIRAHTPVASLVSRHTRDLLREYHRRGMLKAPIATREVADEFLPMSEAEAAVYAAVENYISTTYNNAAPDKRSAVGFVMTTYRKRLSSSFFALRQTLEERLRMLEGSSPPSLQFLLRNEEDSEDDETPAGDEADEAYVDAQKRESLAVEEKDDIRSLLSQVARLPSDTKARHLVEILSHIRSGSLPASDGTLLPSYSQAIVFTQYTDTLDYLRDFLKVSGYALMCYSGRGGEWLQPDGSWRSISREETKRRFAAGEAQVLLCTDAAAEGLNFQYCGALVNFDVPWNPMRVEQRIGRVDRLGQAYPRIAVVNLLYEGTVETDVYRALRERIQLFTSVVGRLQPILSALPNRLAEAALAPTADRERVRGNLVAALKSEVDASAGALDIDELIERALEIRPQPEPAYDLDDLTRLLDRPELLPPQVERARQSSKEVFWTVPGKAQVSVTTDAAFYERHPESVEFWTPGSPVFPEAEGGICVEAVAATGTLRELLDD